MKLPCFSCCRRFWCESIAAEPVAAFRICLSSVLFLSVLFSFLPNVRQYCGPAGLCPLEASEPWFDRAKRICLLRGPQHVPVLEHVISADCKAQWRAWGDRAENVRRMTYIWLLTLAAAALGFCTRLATIAAWLLTMSFQNRFSAAMNGGDILAKVGLFYLMLAPAGRVWSIDAALRRCWRRWRKSETVDATDLESRRITAWPVRLLQIQIAAVYFFTGAYKLWSRNWGLDWLDGSAVYWLLNDIALTRFPYHSFPVPIWICAVLSWGTLVFELAFPLLIISRRIRPLLLIGGVMFHVGILIFTEVGWFSITTLCWYPLFLSAERLKKICHVK